jgi:hypothetical protein
MTEQLKRLRFSFAGKQIEFAEPEPRITAIRMGDFAAHFDEPDRDESAPEAKPEVTMLMPNGVDGLCKLFADGRPVLAGSLREACAALKTLGLQPGGHLHTLSAQRRHRAGHSISHPRRAQGGCARDGVD